MAKLWDFRDFVNARGENIVHAWLDTIPRKAKTKINRVIATLEALPRADWGGDVKVLAGECDGLLELRIELQRVQYRPLMCWGPSRGEVTILLGATERDGDFVPRGVCRSALEHKNEIMNPDRTVEHDFN